LLNPAPARGFDRRATTGRSKEHQSPVRFIEGCARSRPFHIAIHGRVIRWITEPVIGLAAIIIKAPITTSTTVSLAIGLGVINAPLDNQVRTILWTEDPIAPPQVANRFKTLGIIDQMLDYLLIRRELLSIGRALSILLAFGL
jgi:hypothetical protein